MRSVETGATSETSDRGGEIKLRTLFQVLDVAARQCDADLVDFGSGDGASCIISFLVLSDVTHSGGGVCDEWVRR
jgi:hypothetical protein